MDLYGLRISRKSLKEQDFQLTIKVSFFFSLIFLLNLAGGICQPGPGWFPKILTSSNDSVYLPDFSYAGYHWGEQSIPRLSATLNVLDFGAIPNDGLDDTDALLKAFAAAHRVQGTVVLQLPPGRFILKKILYIDRSNFVVQGSGSGPDGTALYMPQPLNKLKEVPDDLAELREYLLQNNKRQREPSRGINEPFSLYAWSGGYIWSRVPGQQAKPYLQKYEQPSSELTKIIQGRRGAHVLEVENTALLKLGQLVRINWYNKTGRNSSLIQHLYDYKQVKVGSRHWENPDMPLVKQEVTITKISGNQVTLKEPLLHDLRPEWYPNMTEWKPNREIGIEHIRFEFAYKPYYAHHLEAGDNAIYFTNTAHSWVQDVAIHNADNGFISDNCANVTVQDVHVSGRTAHYAVQFGDVYNMLAKNILVDAHVLHSLSFNTGARSCVFTGCKVTTEPSLDQHSGANHQNLFDNIELTENNPKRSFFYIGGDGYWAPTHGAFSTFWNIRVFFDFANPGNKTIKIKGVPNGPSARLVGLTANYPMNISYGPAAYMEGINRPGLAIPSLYAYQFKQRMQKKSETEQGEN